MTASQDSDWNMGLEQKCRFAFELYTNLYNALFLATLREHGQAGAEDLMWRLIRSQHEAHFLPGLEKLGLEDEATDAIKAAKYHYLSNRLGGLDVDYAEETPAKVWVRYHPPVMLDISTVAFSAKFGAQAYRGWYGYSGKSLGTPRLGFVLTHNMCDGDPYDAGYYILHDRDLGPEETFRYGRGEAFPRFDRAKAPRLPDGWTAERQARALRNFTIEYVNTQIIELEATYGGAARSVVEHAYAVTMALRRHRFHEALDIHGAGPGAIATLMRRDRALLNEEAAVEKVSDTRYLVRQDARNPRFFPRPADMSKLFDQGVLAGWRTLASLTDPPVTIEMTASLTDGNDCYEWVLTAEE